MSIREAETKVHCVYGENDNLTFSKPRFLRLIYNRSTNQVLDIFRKSQKTATKKIILFEYKYIVISAIYSLFGNLFCFMHSLMYFTRPLQICLFASSTILGGITPFDFLVRPSEFMILKMSSLLTKLKLNKCVVSTGDLILIMLE